MHFKNVEKKDTKQLKNGFLSSSCHPLSLIVSSTVFWPELRKAWIQGRAKCCMGSFFQDQRGAERYLEYFRSYKKISSATYDAPYSYRKKIIYKLIEETCLLVRSHICLRLVDEKLSCIHSAAFDEVHSCGDVEHKSRLVTGNFPLSFVPSVPWMPSIHIYPTGPTGAWANHQNLKGKGIGPERWEHVDAIVHNRSCRWRADLLFPAKSESRPARHHLLALEGVTACAQLEIGTLPYLARTSFKLLRKTDFCIL